jgi:hypothetical protein
MIMPNGAGGWLCAASEVVLVTLTLPPVAVPEDDTDRAVRGHRALG